MGFINNDIFLCDILCNILYDILLFIFILNKIIFSFFLIIEYFYILLFILYNYYETKK